MKPLLLIFLIASTVASAQQLTQFSLHSHNRFAVNPATAGSESYIPVLFSYKQYWTGFNDAPRFQNLSAHGIISRRVGVGVKLFSYYTGPLDKSGAEIAYAYHIPVSASGAKLSFGLSGSIYQYAIDKNKVSFENPKEPLLVRLSDKMIIPDFNFGTCFYTEKAYIGISFLQLLNRKIDMMVSTLDQKQITHLLVHGGYNFIINDKFSVEPNVLVKYMPQSFFQVDIGAKFKYDYVWIGASFRTDDAISASFGFSKDNIIVGYAYDYMISGLTNYANGTHEIILGYKINPQKPKVAQL
ncbi:MAG: hypothetical protein A2X01_18610 [Bacteroidetes bacterium GWF2_35_48]|nr:MAG: hypothetical protein A2X01_18610 [Bacteroidetes bacterium GWF2_35_48]